MKSARHGAPSTVTPVGLPDERRRERRFASRKLVNVLYDMAPIRAWLIQCSARGVAILTTTPLPTGGQFMIQLHLDGVPCLLIYAVRATRQERPNTYRIGGELTRISAPAAATYQAILDALLRE